MENIDKCAGCGDDIREYQEIGGEKYCMCEPCAHDAGLYR